MRIFLSLSPSGNASVPNSMTWIHNLYEPLLDLGHEVYLVRIDEAASYLKVNRNSSSFKEKFSEYLLEIFKREHKKKQFDLFFSYFTNNHIYPRVIDEIKKMGVPTANFSCNNTHQFYLTKEIAPYYDFNLHSEKSAGEKFTEIGAKPVWFQMAANPKYYHPVKIEFKYDVGFLGSSYAKRAEYIYHLLENEINVNCFGPNWLINRPNEKLKKIYKENKKLKKMLQSLLSFSASKRYFLSAEINNYELQCLLRSKYRKHLHYPILDKDLITLFNETKINLGFLEVFASDNKVGTHTQQHLHLREFEIPMSGGLYITNYSDELAEHYEPDKEVLVFHNEYELIDKIKYYLKNEKEAGKIRKAGLQRALNCHTYQKRFIDLFKEIGIVNEN